MQILSVDIGTGTQDIYLYQSGVSLENGFKLVMPSPTMLIRGQIQAATRRGEDILLTGVTMGGGPCQWAAQEHLRAGHSVFATPQAARTFNDDLDWVCQEMGVTLVEEHETPQLSQIERIHMQDFNYAAIRRAFESFHVRLNPAAVAIAVFDHGEAPPGVSDRQFRFDYLRSRIEAENRLSAFAYSAQDIPAAMTRMQSVSTSAQELDCPIIIMDTAPAAVLGAGYDPMVAGERRVMIVNVGNFHALAFRMGPGGIEGVFEHHTGEIDLPRLETLLLQLADGSLTHEDVFHDQGHGALIFDPQPLGLLEGSFGIAVTGPRRSMLADSRLRPYFAVPFGDMMLSGCFGLLSAATDLLPDLAGPIREALQGAGTDVAPWDIEI